MLGHGQHWVTRQIEYNCKFELQSQEEFERVMDVYPLAYLWKEQFEFLLYLIVVATGMVMRIRTCI